MNRIKEVLLAFSYIENNISFCVNCPYENMEYLFYPYSSDKNNNWDIMQDDKNDLYFLNDIGENHTKWLASHVILKGGYIESTCHDKRQMNIFSLLKEIKNLKTFIEMSEGK